MAERTFKKMLSEAGVELRLNAVVVEGPAGLRVERQRGSRIITALAIEGAASPTWIQARYVIDASCECYQTLGLCRAPRYTASIIPLAS